MINDARLILDDAAALTSGSIDSTNVLDLGLSDPNIGAGTRLTLRCTVNTTFTGGTSISARFCSCQTVGGTYVGMASSDAIAAATLIAGYTLLEAVITSKHLRFLKVIFTIVATFSAGKVDTYINMTN
jgi:hypothetical protein